MNAANQPFLTIFIEADALPGDPMDSSAETKHLMIATADGLVDAAVGKMPGYLDVLPDEVRPSSSEIATSLRRSYRIKGNKLEMDLTMRRANLPSAWVKSLAPAEVPSDPSQIPWAIRWTARILGWFMGVSAKDRQRVMIEAHEATRRRRLDTIKEEICVGMMKMTGAAVEVELHGMISSILGNGTLRKVSMWRAL